MAEAGITLEFDGAIARLTISDAARKNSISLAMAADFRKSLALAQAKARVLVVSGANEDFCSGANLSADAGLEDRISDLGMVLETHFNPLAMDLRNLDIPWIASVRGAAAGIGCALALAGDLVICSETAYFLQAFRHIGLVPDGGSAYLLTRSAGRVRAMEMMLLGEKIPAETARQWGLVNRVVPSEKLNATVDEIAHKLASGPTMALGLTRKSAWAALELDLKDSLALERELQKQAGETADFLEGLSAFRERRPARFAGS